MMTRISREFRQAYAVFNGPFLNFVFLISLGLFEIGRESAHRIFRRR